MSSAPPAPTTVRWWGRVPTRLRWLVVAAWLLGTAAALHWLPGLGSTSGGFNQLVPPNLPAVTQQEQVLQEFGVPVLSRQVAVIRSPEGLSPVTQARILAACAKVSLGSQPGLEHLAGAFPLPDTGGVVPTSTGSGIDAHTVVVYLWFRPGVSSDVRVAESERFLHQDLPSPGPGGVAALTGAVPAEVAQGELISGHLRLIELATAVLVALAVALFTRSLVAPLLALTATGLALALTMQALGVAVNRLGLTAPSALEPVIVALVVGIMTDYTLFYAFAHRDALRHGADDAAAEAATRITPIVGVAVLTVASGTALLGLARLGLYSSLGPGLAIATLVAGAVAITFVPAGLAVLGRRAYWPSTRWWSPDADPRPHRVRRWLTRSAVYRPVAAIVVVLGASALVFAASPLRSTGLGANLMTGLPSGSGPHRALDAAAKGFAPGIISPLEVVVHQQGLSGRAGEVSALQHEIDQQSTVAGTIGPAQEKLAVGLGAAWSRSGDAARILVLLRSDPHTARSVNAIRSLEGRMPELLARAGLPGATVGYAGDGAIITDVIGITLRDLLVVGLSILVVHFLLLSAFLRSLVAPVLVLGASLLVVAGSLGATAWVWERLAPGDGLTFYVPVGVAVLLVSFGSDYNLLVIGEIWAEARVRPFREAIVHAATNASAAVSAAGFTLAVSFAMLALIPVGAFRQLAIALSLGVLVDTFVVRSYIVPAALSLLGRRAAWPGALSRGDPPTAQGASTVDADRAGGDRTRQLTHHGHPFLVSLVEGRRGAPRGSGAGPRRGCSAQPGATRAHCPEGAEAGTPAWVSAWPRLSGTVTFQPCDASVARSTCTSTDWPW